MRNELWATSFLQNGNIYQHSSQLISHSPQLTAHFSQQQVREITWCPKLIGQKLKVTTLYGIDKKFERISEELDKHPEFAPYIAEVAGTFNWRKIAGTDRLSMHSFGMTMDINAKFSHYWQWDCKCKNEDVVLGYNNLIPQKIVRIFEKNGFIWGGKWYHYDTMHFEYRQELL